MGEDRALLVRSSMLIALAALRPLPIVNSRFRKAAFHISPLPSNSAEQVNDMVVETVCAPQDEDTLVAARAAHGESRVQFDAWAWRANCTRRWGSPS